MAEEAESKTTIEEAPAPAGEAMELPWFYGAMGWFVPGLGHFLLKKYDRAGVFFFSILAMGGMGLAMGGKLYAPPFTGAQGLFLTVLHVFGFLADLGAGVLYFIARLAGLGGPYMGRALGDYGTMFFLCAGLLNLLTALDAYDIAAGKKE